MGERQCEAEGCITHASRGHPPRRRVAHGGGKWCKQEDCTKSAQGGTGFCIALRGARRCPKAARGRTHHGGSWWLVMATCLSVVVPRGLAEKTMHMVFSTECNSYFDWCQAASPSCVPP